jgi:hypothetical protein
MIKTKLSPQSSRRNAAKDAENGLYPLTVFLRFEIAPSATQIARASHSYAVKWPGTSGINFISAMAIPTAKPNHATARFAAENFINSGRVRAIARQEAHVADHPMAHATDPTSVTGTRIASPNSIQAAVASPVQRTAADGVW